MTHKPIPAADARTIVDALFNAPGVDAHVSTSPTVLADGAVVTVQVRAFVPSGDLSKLRLT